MSSCTKTSCCKRRKLNEDDDNEANMTNTVMLTIIMAICTQCLLSHTNGRGDEVHRVRKDLELDVIAPLGDTFFRRAYRMEKESFFHLHSMLRKDLEKQFFPAGGGSRDIRRSSYLIRTEMRLSMAIRFFAGGDPYDIMVIHGVSYMSVFNAVWGIVDVVNNSPLLKITFPTHEEQEEIALGFSTMSGADFDKVILALDGILIWIQKPSKREARANGEFETT